MNAPFRTPDVRPRPTDAELANAFRDLESPINQARDAAITAELVFDGAGNPGEYGEVVRKRAGLSEGYTVLVLTEDQFKALHHTMRHARDEADALYKAFYAGFEADPA